MSAHDHSFAGLEGGEIHLSDFAGHPILVVNTASECGFTPQYADLESLWSRFRERGLIVLGVPSNDFGEQEPGDAAAIRAFCDSRYGVTFPLTAKQRVIGTEAHPFYRWIAAELGEGAAPGWNFYKYLIGPDGQLVGLWPAKVAPLDAEITDTITSLLDSSAS